MSYAPVPIEFGMLPDPRLEREAALVRIAEHALRLNDKLLAERAQRGKTRRRKK